MSKKRLEHFERPEGVIIEEALEVAFEGVACGFIINDNELREQKGFVHLKLPDHYFLVSDEVTQISYVVRYNQIKWIGYLKEN